jgi:hypothetical protein
MFVQQISVFLENKSGSLADFTKLLGDQGFDLMSLSIADTTDFGILRVIVADCQRAQSVLTDAGYSIKVSDVLAVSVPDHPGALAGVISRLSTQGIGVEYLYSFFHNQGDHALIVIRTDQPNKALDVLKNAGIHMLSQEDLQAI